MEKIRDYLEKIIKKTGDKGAYYSYGKEYRSTMDKPIFMANVVWTKQGLAILKLLEYSQEDLLKELKKYYRTTNDKTLAIRYHQNQVAANEMSIKHHKQTIEAYEKK